MIEFFNSIGAWFVEHKDAIVTFVTSSSFVALVGAILTTVKSLKGNADVKKTLNEAAEGLKTTLGLSDGINDVSDKLTEIAPVVNSLKTSLDKVDSLEKRLAMLEATNADALNALINKVNAILDVQATAYQTVRDDATRTTINAIINGAKYTDTTNRAEMKGELADFKTEVADKLAALQELVNMSTASLELRLGDVEATQKAPAEENAEAPVVERY